MAGWPRPAWQDSLDPDSTDYTSPEYDSDGRVNPWGWIEDEFGTVDDYHPDELIENKRKQTPANLEKALQKKKDRAADIYFKEYSVRSQARQRRRAKKAKEEQQRVKKAIQARVKQANQEISVAAMIVKQEHLLFKRACEQSLKQKRSAKMARSDRAKARALSGSPLVDPLPSGGP